MGKRMVSALLSFCLILTLLPFSAGAAESLDPAWTDPLEMTEASFCEETEDSSLPEQTEGKILPAEAAEAPVPDETAPMPEAAEPVDEIVFAEKRKITVSETASLSAVTVSGDEMLPFSEFEYQVLLRTNKKRLAVDAVPLTGFASLQKACDIRAREIGSYFSHTRPNGKSFSSVLDEVGIDCWYAGENIAYGYQTPADVIDGWMNSDGHRRNMLNKNYRHLGTGFKNFGWVQVFLADFEEVNESATVYLPEYVEEGTKIKDMDLYAEIQNSVFGTCYLPITAEYVTGYDPDTPGVQQITITFLEFTGTFPLPVVEKMDTPKLTAENLPETGDVQLSWTASAGAKEYRVYRSAKEDSGFSQVLTTSETSWVDPEAKIGKTYYYYVVAVGPYDNPSKRSSKVSRAKDLPQPVMTLSHDAQTGRVKIQWEAVEGAGKYGVYRAVSETGKYSNIKTVKGLSYIDTSGKSGVLYYYKIRALAEKSASNSAYSQIRSLSCRLSAPVVTACNQEDTGKIQLKWKKISGAGGYEIYRAEENGAYAFLADTEDTSYTDASAQPGKVYSYQLKAVNDDPEAASAFSETVTQLCRMGRPVVKTGNDAASGKVRLTWDAVDGADCYEVYRAAAKKGAYTLLETVYQTGFTDTSLAARKTGYYYVQAVDAKDNRSEPSAAVSCVCDVAQPVISLTNLHPSGDIRVSWEKVEGAKSYQVYRATSENGKYSSVKTTTSDGYTDTTAKPGVRYYYKVRAQASKSNANSAWSPIQSLTCRISCVSITGSHDGPSGKPVLTWKKVSGASGYEIYRSGEAGEREFLTETAALSWTDETAQACRPYSYEIKAVNGDSEGESGYSAPEILVCKLPVPEVSFANEAVSGKILLTWESSAGAVQWDIFRSTSRKGTYRLLGSTEKTEFLDETAKAGKTCYYKIQAAAADSDAGSAQSAARSWVCDLERPVLQAEANSKGQPKLSWEKVSGAKKYRISRSQDGESWTSVKTTTERSWTDTAAKSGETWYYRLEALASGSSANSAPSAPVTFRMP